MTKRERERERLVETKEDKRNREVDPKRKTERGRRKGKKKAGQVFRVQQAMNGPLTGVGESSGLKTSPVITSTHNSYHHFQETLLLSLFLIFFPDVQAERGISFTGRSGTLSAPVPAPALDRRGSSTPFLLRLKKPSFFALVVAGKAVAVLPTRLAWRLWPLFGLRMLTRWTSGLRMVARRASGLRM